MRRVATSTMASEAVVDDEGSMADVGGVGDDDGKWGGCWGAIFAAQKTGLGFHLYHPPTPLALRQEEDLTLEPAGWCVCLPSLSSSPPGRQAGRTSGDGSVPGEAPQIQACLHASRETPEFSCMSGRVSIISIIHKR